MGNIWSYTADNFDPDHEIVGYKVDATDGTIGKIDEATYEARSGFIIVDTGPWIFGRKVLLPAGIITSIDHDDEVVVVGRSMDEIKAAPEFVQGHQNSEALREPHAEYHRALWTGL